MMGFPVMKFLHWFQNFINKAVPYSLDFFIIGKSPIINFPIWRLNRNYKLLQSNKGWR